MQEMSTMEVEQVAGGGLVGWLLEQAVREAREALADMMTPQV